jgi:hypothetical protein
VTIWNEKELIDACNVNLEELPIEEQETPRKTTQQASLTDFD